MIMPPGQLCQFRKPGQDGIIVFSPVRKCTGRTVFDPFLRIGETSAAGLAQGIERAVTKKAVKHFLRNTGVAGKHLTFFVLKKTNTVIYNENSRYYRLIPNKRQ